MSFITPLMLYGGLAASIPIALHFFYRSRYRTLPWAAMKFLLTSVEQTSRRLHFQELLLLLARIALLVLLAIALARPSSSAGRGSSRGDAVDAVFVMDTSYSMDTREGPTTRLQDAKTAAMAVIDQLPPHSTVQIIACSDRSTRVGPQSPSNLDQARKVIEDLQISHQATDFLPGMMDASEAMTRGHSPNKEVYLFSDMQKLGWEQQAPGLTEQLRKIGEKSTVYMVRCGTRTPRNVAIVEIVPQSGVPHTGERAGFAVMVRNTGSEPMKNLTLSLFVDGDQKQKESQTIPNINRGETRAVPMTVKLDKVGLRVLSAEVAADDLDADNHFDQVVYVRDQVRVLIVDGQPDERDPSRSASFQLSHALASSKSPVKQRIMPAGQVSAAHLANQDVVMLVDVALHSHRKAEGISRDFIKHLTEWVQQGHALVIFAGDNVVPDAYNNLLLKEHKLLPMPLTGVTEAPAGKPFHLDRTSVSSLFFQNFKDDENYQGLNFVEVKRALDVKEPEKKDQSDSVNVVLRYSTGKPAVITKKAGAGEVMLVTTAGDPRGTEAIPDPRWTNWPVLPMFVPFLDMSLSHLLHRQTQSHNSVAGAPIRWQAPEADANRAFTLIAPDGRKQRLGLPVLDGDRPLVTATQTPRAGIYRIVAADAMSKEEKEPEGVPFAVIPDLRESENLEALSDVDIDGRLGFSVVHMKAGSDMNATAGAERLKHEWTMWWLVAVLAVALGETVLAWLCGKAW